MQLLDRVKQAREAAAFRISHPLTMSETVTHGAYFAFVFLEGHGIYAIVASVLFCFVVIRIIVGVLH